MRKFAPVHICTTLESAQQDTESDIILQKSSILETAEKAARAAGEIQRQRFGTMLNVDLAQRHDIKLEVDRLCEQAIVDIIRQSCPDHDILSEELGYEAGDGAYRWIIDPLDGTVNFYYGIRYFCVSIACYRKIEDDAVLATADEGSRAILQQMGEPVCAVVYAPMADELFCAEAGKGLYLNQTPVHATEITDLAEALVVTGFGSKESDIKQIFEIKARIATSARKLRCLGSAASDLAGVACGRLSGYFEVGIRTWDLAAGIILVNEAGGKTRAVEIEPGIWQVCAAGKGIFDQLIREVDAV